MARHPRLTWVGRTDTFFSRSRGRGSLNHVERVQGQKLLRGLIRCRLCATPSCESRQQRSKRVAQARSEDSEFLPMHREHACGDRPSGNARDSIKFSEIPSAVDAPERAKLENHTPLDSPA